MHLGDGLFMNTTFKQLGAISNISMSIFMLNTSTQLPVLPHKHNTSWSVCKLSSICLSRDNTETKLIDLDRRLYLCSVVAKAYTSMGILGIAWAFNLPYPTIPNLCTFYLDNLFVHFFFYFNAIVNEYAVGRFAFIFVQHRQEWVVKLRYDHLKRYIQPFPKTQWMLLFHSQ